jgi:hypothetical protein
MQTRVHHANTAQAAEHLLCKACLLLQTAALLIPFLHGAEHLGTPNTPGSKQPRMATYNTVL